MGKTVFLLNVKGNTFIWCLEKRLIKPVANNYWIKIYEYLSEGEIWRNLGMKCMDPILENFTFFIEA